MRICFDLDETLCTGYPYENCRPKSGAAQLLKRIKEEGHTIIIHTARRMDHHQGNLGKVIKTIGLLTLTQLNDWGFTYDELLFGKPSADLYVDDKALEFSSFKEMEQRVLRRAHINQ